MRTQHLRALTGVRFFAALWVVLYHSTRHNVAVLSENHPDFLRAIAPVTAAGVRGVDLFFILSGFVLALNYMDQLGPRLELRTTLRFLWLRLARIWPLYMLVILAAGLLRVLRHELWESASVDRLTGWSLTKQALMVQQWFPTPGEPIGWVGPAWSLSAEWLAYLAFPVLVLLVARGHRRLRARTLLVLAGVAMVPLVWSISVQGNMSGLVWLPRILCEFVTGMLLCAGLARLDVTQRMRRVAGIGAILCTVAVVGWLYFVRNAGLPNVLTFYIVVLFVPLVACLAVGAGPLNSLLATRALVLGGGISYALYLVHSPMLYLFRDATHYTGALYLPPLQRYYAELLFIPVIVFTAWLAYRFFEEPVRMLMRRMLPPTRHGSGGPGGPPDRDDQLDRSIARNPTTSPRAATTPAPTKP